MLKNIPLSVFSRLLTDLQTGHSLTWSWFICPRADIINMYHPQLMCGWIYKENNVFSRKLAQGFYHWLCPVVSPTVIRNSSNMSGEFACLACFGKRGLSSCERRLCSNFLLSTARQWIWLFIIEEGWVRMVTFPVQQEQHEPCSRFLWEFPWSCQFQTQCIMLLRKNVGV